MFQRQCRTAYGINSLLHTTKPKKTVLSSVNTSVSTHTLYLFLIWLFANRYITYYMLLFETRCAYPPYENNKQCDGFSAMWVFVVFWPRLKPTFGSRSFFLHCRENQIFGSHWYYIFIKRNPILVLIYRFLIIQFIIFRLYTKIHV